MICTESYVGEVRNNNFGTPMKIITARKKSDIDIQFLDEHRYIKKHLSYQAFKLGQIKNPFDRTICDVGYLGIGNNFSRVKGETVAENLLEELRIMN